MEVMAFESTAKCSQNLSSLTNSLISLSQRPIKTAKFKKNKTTRFVHSVLDACFDGGRVKYI